MRITARSYSPVKAFSFFISVSRETFLRTGIRHENGEDKSAFVVVKALTYVLYMFI